MNSFWRIFSLEHLAFVRSKTLAMLVGASAAWMFALPMFLKGDGTLEGVRELYIRYSLGGVFALLLIALLSSATGSLARERAAKRLQLTLVRPVHYFAIVLAKALAHLAIGAEVLLVAFVILACRGDLGLECSHVLKPILPSPKEEAKAMYETFMADPDTPIEVKRAKKDIVLRLLENKARDHYQTLPTNEVITWRFPISTSTSLPNLYSVRLRFTNQFDSRDDVRGVFTLGEAQGVVSNITQAVIKIPLLGAAKPSGEDGFSSLSFRNEGKNALMLRPRRDLDLLIPADSFAVNLIRAYLMMLSILAMAIAFGLLLSAALGRPVALFVAIVTLLLSEMSPSVIEQYPDELETKRIDRIGLVFTRLAAEVTRPVATLNPLEKLSLDECVEWKDVSRAISVNIVACPFIFALLAGFLLPRKEEE